MTNFELNIANQEFAENINGLMICGYEWGFSKEDQKLVEAQKYEHEEKSYFSDKRVNDYPYRNRILSWLDLLGLSLNKDSAGSIERSIVQTNWMDSQGYKMEGNTYIKLREQKENFLNHIEYFKPRVILFFGVEQLKVLNREILKEAEEILGKTIKQENYIQKEFDTCVKYKLGFQSFENTEIIAFPHPASRGGICDEYIASYEDIIAPIFNKYIKEIDINR